MNEIHHTSDVKNETTQSLIAKALQTDRLSKKMTQQEVADKLGVGQQSWSKWEAGINLPRQHRMECIATFFGPDSMTAKVVSMTKNKYPKLNERRGSWEFKSIDKSDFDSLDFVQKAIVEKTLKTLIETLAVQKYL